MEHSKQTGLIRYIQRVIEDAYKSENRANDTTFSAYLIDDDNLLVLLNCKYLRVYRRVMFRLDKNLPKNFGIKLLCDGNSKRFESNNTPDFRVDDHCEAGYGVGYIFDNNHHYFIELTAIGNKTHLLHHGLNGSTVQDILNACDAIRAKMEAVGGKQYYYSTDKDAYATYRADYLKAFGEEAVEVSIVKLI